MHEDLVDDAELLRRFRGHEGVAVDALFNALQGLAGVLRVDVVEARSQGHDLSRLNLDVGGGTGAFAITLCKAFPGLDATVVDFPNVAAIGRKFVEKAGLSDRIHYIEGDGLKADWPRNQDVILMSYLLSGIPGETHDGMIKRAFDHLAPGGRLLIHDFVVSADRTGPKLAALWQLQHTAFTPEARSVDDAWLIEVMEKHGFKDAKVDTMIPEMTMLAQAVKPA